MEKTLSAIEQTSLQIEEIMSFSGTQIHVFYLILIKRKNSEKLNDFFVFITMNLHKHFNSLLALWRFYRKVFVCANEKRKKAKFPSNTNAKMWKTNFLFTHRLTICCSSIVFTTSPLCSLLPSRNSISFAKGKKQTLVELVWEGKQREIFLVFFSSVVVTTSLIWYGIGGEAFHQGELYCTTINI